MVIFASTTILNKYRVVRQIGQGGMGRVWLAEEMIFGNRPVAIKEARSDLPQSELEDVQRRYKQEVEIYAALQREQAPNIVPVYTVEPYEESALLVMAYMPNGDLDAALRRQEGGGLTPERALEITAALLLALRAAHEHVLEIVHRDIKPSNVLFDEANRAHLADFGLAQLGGTSNRSQAGGTRKHPGTPAYMAPEQADSTEYLAPAADIYAVGCVLFEMLTGKRYKRVRPDTKPSALRPETPAWVDTLVGKALAQDRYDRYEDAGEMLRALQTGRTQIVSEQERRQAEAEKERAAEAERARLVEAEQERAAEAERQRQAEADRDKEAESQRQVERQRQAEVEKERQAEAARQTEIERQRLAEAERQRQAEAERQRQAEVERQRQTEAERKRQTEATRQRKAEAESQRLLESQPQQQAKTASVGTFSETAPAAGTSLIPSRETLSIILKTGLVVLWLVTGFGLLSLSLVNFDRYDSYPIPSTVWLGAAFLFWSAVGQWAILQTFHGPSRWWLTYSAGASILAAILGALWMLLGPFGPLLLIVQLLVVTSIQWFRLRRYVKKAFLWVTGSVLGFLPPLLFVYFLFSVSLLWWLLKYQAKQGTAAADGDIVHPVEPWRRITASPADNSSGIPVTLGKKWRFLVEWVVVSVIGIIIGAIPVLYSGVSSGGAAIVVPLLLFGMAAGQWLVLRIRLTSSRRWLIYSAIGGAAAAVAGLIGNQFSDWPSPSSYTGMLFLQLLLVSTSQWLKLREYVPSAFVWPVSNVVVGTAAWTLGFAVSSTLEAWALVLFLAYLLILGVTMWWLLTRRAKQRTSPSPENG